MNSQVLKFRRFVLDSSTAQLMTEPSSFTRRAAAAVGATIAIGAALGVLPAQPAAPSTPQTVLTPLQTVPLGTTRANWLNGGVASANGRFYLFSTFAADSLTIYDSRARKWVADSSAKLGSDVVWSPDSRFIAFSRSEPPARVRLVWLMPMDSATGKPQGPARRISTRSGNSPAWSPDGRRIAFINNDSSTFSILEVPFSGGEARVLHAEPGQGSQLRWTADGKTLFAMYGARGWENWLRYDVASSQVTHFASSTGWPLMGISPDGQRVASSFRGGSTLYISSATTGRLLATYATPERFEPTTWSADGQSVIGAEHVPTAHVESVRVSDGVITHLTSLDSTFLGDVKHSPDGAKLLYAKSMGSLSQLQVLSAKGGASHALGKPIVGRFGKYEWSPDGRSVLYCQLQSIHIVDVASGVDRALVELRQAEGPPLSQCGWRADGNAVRTIRSPLGEYMREHEAHETSLRGVDRVLSRFTTSSRPHMVDDSLVAFTSPDGLTLRNIVRQQERLIFRGKMWGTVTSWSPDGQRLAFVTSENDNAVPYVLNVRSGVGLRVPFTLGGEVNQVQFLPDGRSLIAYACISCVAPDFVEKWDIVVLPINGEPPRVLTASQKSYRDHANPSISPDGLTLVFSAEATYNTRVAKMIIPPR